ncbi:MULTISPECIES: DUF6463 family protein [unclassified Streptomyces]|uniref:DUF6463 family protein n=1 Tax=unclassified Streptomyces TaxID=2593676 RepID=UPI0023B304B3|nr:MULTISPECIES: DUF6463 family protein [unclassified Streptomyces]
MSTSARSTPRIPESARLARWVPRLILAGAIVHMVGAAANSRWRGIFSDGLWNTVGAGNDTRVATLWFMIGGIALFGPGILTRTSVMRTGKVPVETGWILLGLGIPIALLEPASGAWLLIAIGVLALVTARQGKEHADVA